MNGNGGLLHTPESIIETNIHTQPIQLKMMTLSYREMNLIHWLRREVKTAMIISLMTNGVGEPMMVLSAIDARKDRL